MNSQNIPSLTFEKPQIHKLFPERLDNVNKRNYYGYCSECKNYKIGGVRCPTCKKNSKVYCAICKDEILYSNSLKHFEAKSKYLAQTKKGLNQNTTECCDTFVLEQADRWVTEKAYEDQEKKYVALKEQLKEMVPVKYTFLEKGKTVELVQLTINTENVIKQIYQNDEIMKTFHYQRVLSDEEFEKRHTCLVKDKVIRNYFENLFEQERVKPIYNKKLEEHLLMSTWIAYLPGNYQNPIGIISTRTKRVTDEKPTIVVSLVVFPDHQKKGFAKLMCKALLAYYYSRKENLKLLKDNWVSVTSIRDGSGFKLCKKLDFQENGETNLNYSGDRRVIFKNTLDFIRRNCGLSEITKNPREEEINPQ